MMDIGDIINFKTPAMKDGIEKIKIDSILGLKITVLKWEMKVSKFDNHANFMEITIKTEDDKKYKLNTGSKVILSQLQEIGEKFPMGTEFTCVIKKYANFYKMFPVSGEKK